MNHDRDALIELIGRACGRDVSSFDDAFLALSLQRRALATGAVSTDAYATCLATDAAEAMAFARSLDVTFSTFFRDSVTFALLEQWVLPTLAQARSRTGRREIRVWSAGCAAGQEPYSVAILLNELTVARTDDLTYRIFASDISYEQLAEARQGVYSGSSLENVRLCHLNRYFTRHGDFYQVSSGLRDHIEFALHDLLDERLKCPETSIFGDFDLVLCRNLLFYYRAELRQTILDKVTACLAPHGYLVTGETERQSVEQGCDLESVVPPVAIFQRTHKMR